MKRSLIAISVGWLLLTSGCQAPKGPGLAQYVYKTIEGRKLTLDFEYPPDWQPSDKRPAIVFFCGGGWLAHNVAQFKPQAEYFAKRGLVCARADFQFPVEKLDWGDAAWLDRRIDDARSAVRWMRSQAAQLGIDPNRIVAAGSSSGGHLAACTFFGNGMGGADDDKPVSAKPNAMVLYNPAVNLLALRALAPIDGTILKRISPSFHVCKDTPPTLVIDGTADELLPQIREFIERSKSAGAPVEVCYMKGQPHGFFNNSPWLEKTTREANDFLCRIGYLREEPRVPLPSRANW